MEVETKEKVYIDQKVKFVDIGFAVPSNDGSLVVEQLTLTEDDYMSQTGGVLQVRFANPPHKLSILMTHVAWLRERDTIRQIEAPPAAG